MAEPLVSVTGGSGHLGSQIIEQLLRGGYTVRTTVRSQGKGKALAGALEKVGVPVQGLSWVEADLNSDRGWAEAVRDCRYVLHVASPFVIDSSASDETLIPPAVNGSLRVLRAARDAGVGRVVLTSSFVAVAFGQPVTKGATVLFDESSWTNLDAPLPPYYRSKTLAERAAWDFVKTEGRGMELAVVNPVGILGPVLFPQMTPSLEVVVLLLRGSMPAVPKIAFPIVDVRDAADLHLRAMLSPEAAGQRFLATGDDVPSLLELARCLKQALGADAARVPAGPLPDAAVKLFSFFRRDLRQIVDDLGWVRGATNQKARTLLGWKPRPKEETMEDTARSLMAHGLVQKRG